MGAHFLCHYSYQIYPDFNYFLPKKFFQFEGKNLKLKIKIKEKTQISR